jgi:DNA-binding NarL/FixJ family response regulator
MAFRVVVVEDDLLVREGVRALLAASPDLEIAAACGDLDAAYEAVEAERPDVVLTDIQMPPTKTDEGIRLANRLKETHPDVGVVVLSQFDEAAYALALFERGARGRGYLLKQRLADLDQLVIAIREVAGGGTVVDTLVVDKLVAARAQAPRSALAWLTPRETEVLAEMAQGKSNAAIAASVSLTVRAVEKHINAIFSKLSLAEEADLNRRVKAVLMFLAEQR